VYNSLEQLLTEMRLKGQGAECLGQGGCFLLLMEVTCIYRSPKTQVVTYFILFLIYLERRKEKPKF
jgi:hypothetical protein